MNKSKLLSLTLAIVVIIISSCSKDQKIVNQLEGTWKITSVIENGVAQPDSTYKNSTYKFEKCKVKKGQCGGSITDSGKSYPFTYDISEKGKKISITLTAFGITETSDIVEHSKKKFVLKFTDGGDVTETTLEK